MCIPPIWTLMNRKIPFIFNISKCGQISEKKTSTLKLVTMFLKLNPLISKASDRGFARFVLYWAYIAASTRPSTCLCWFFHCWSYNFIDQKLNITEQIWITSKLWSTMQNRNFNRLVAGQTVKDKIWRNFPPYVTHPTT